MAKSKSKKITKRSHHKKVVPIEFPLPVDPAATDVVPQIEELPDLTKLKEPEDYTVACQVTSVGTHFWGGTMFVALEATDGQNLVDLLRQWQTVTLHYKKETKEE